MSAGAAAGAEGPEHRGADGGGCQRLLPAAHTKGMSPSCAEASTTGGMISSYTGASTLPIIIASCLAAGPDIVMPSILTITPDSHLCKQVQDWQYCKMVNLNWDWALQSH